MIYFLPVTHKLRTYVRNAVWTLLAIVIISMSSSVSAQIPGTTTSTTSFIDIREDFNGIALDPTPNKGARVEMVQHFGATFSDDLASALIKNILSAAGINIPGWMTDLIGGVSFFCSGIDPSFEASAGVDIGAYYEIKNVGTADIAIRYPVSVNVEYPEANTFACGDTIKIATTWTVLNANSDQQFRITPPVFSHELGPVLDNLFFRTQFGINAWVGFGVEVPYPCASGICYEEICSDKKYFNKSTGFSIEPNLPTLPPFLTVCESAFGPNASTNTLLDCQAYTGITPFLKTLQDWVDQANSTLGTSFSMATFPDNNTVVVAPPDLPSLPGIPPLPEMEGVFKRVVKDDLSFSEMNSGKNLSIWASNKQVSDMYFDLVSMIDYTGIPTSVSLGSGLGSIDLGDLAPTFTVDQDMRFDFNPVIGLTVNLGMEMAYAVYNEDDSPSGSGFGQYVQLNAGQYILAEFPQNCSTPSYAGGKSKLEGNIKSEVSQDYWTGFDVRFAEVNLVDAVDFALVDESLPSIKIAERTVIDHTLNIQANSEYSLSNFVIDPENPIINIESLTVEDELNLGAGERAVVYKLVISNDGDVKLSDLELDFDLGETFSTALFSVECQNGDSMLLNPDYDGSSDINLLGAGNVLEPGEKTFVEVLVKVVPEIAGISEDGCFIPVDYLASAKAYGVSPIGTEVENNYNQCTDMVTADDIVAEIDLGATVIESLNDFVVYGFTEVKIDKPQQMSMGNAGSAGDFVFENSSLQGGDLTEIIGDIFVGGELFIQGESRVLADYLSTSEKVKMPNWKAQLSLNGALAENSDCVPMFEPPNIAFPKINSKTSVTVPPGEANALLPGSYKSVVLSEGSELILSSGEYYIGQWKFLGDDISVHFEISGAPVILNLETWQPLGRSVQFYIVGGSVQDVIYNYTGKQKCAFNQSVVRGMIVAPNAEVEFVDETLFEGVCYADKVNFKTGSYYRGPTYVNPINIGSDCQDVLVPGTGSMEKSGNIAQFGDNSGAETFDREIKIYPNPTDDFVTISGLSGEATQIRVFNVTGQLVRQVESAAPELKIYLGDQSPGVYYIRAGDTGIGKVIRK
ncbi:T9SS type A sorting domain-containing protein [Maribellus sediminis]|uniref:T9SS type A sorting domain-containing protein n=1 Tax=Maribellus sediminis TaxID=2696285 RepID=UPI0014315D16|nr:T9SS type A sorting domain-containing protein [Maribellus sediminis]